MSVPGQEERCIWNGLARLALGTTVCHSDFILASETIELFVCCLTKKTKSCSKLLFLYKSKKYLHQNGWLRLNNAKLT